ncbi:protein phosphatase 2C domain-containing protein [Streptomyces sp. SID3343]|uniref:protein phosphatase 2C domain-containing protein n=1 Tax=Streptomyces sp. SID3343 TaxID=2690260 RepID=UPI0031F76DE8
MSGHIWQHGTATVSGLGKRCNQDGVGGGTITDPPAEWAAVADGHGSAAYVRSDLGARVAVELFGATLVRLWAEHAEDGRRPLTAAARGRLVHDFPRDLVRAWREHVALHHWNNPTRPRAEQPSTLYGSTFIGALTLPELLVCWQLGDGDLVLIDADGTCTTPLDSGEVVLGEATESLCGPEAWRSMRVHWVPLRQGSRPPALVMLSSDGLSKSFVDRPGFLAFARGVFERLRAEGSDRLLERDLPHWLGEAARHSGDDTSVALLWPTAAVPQAAPRGPDRHEGAKPGPDAEPARESAAEVDLAPGSATDVDLAPQSSTDVGLAPQSSTDDEPARESAHGPDRPQGITA